VTNAWERAVSAVVTVEFGLEGDKSGSVVESLTGTVEHPVYTERGWVGLGELGIGTKIVTRAGRVLWSSRFVGWMPVRFVPVIGE
jgi:hypothetical protein